MTQKVTGEKAVPKGCPMEKINIREMALDDYVGVRAVDELTQRQFLGASWDMLEETAKEAHLKSRRSEFELNLATGYCFVGLLGESVVGFVLALETLPFRGTLYIRHIAVHPAYQGSGVGTSLYRTLVAKARRSGIRKITALINLDNLESIKLHEKLGFELIERKQAFLVLE
jgi:ribosomal protein S18 acetylase RimI-like enzyme